MNIDTYAGISVAHYVAMRKLDNSEIEKIVKQVEQSGEYLFERASRVMSRVSFVDEIRYSIQLDLTDPIECIERGALETYLLCSCLDTLASKDNYVEMKNWLEAKDLTILGIKGRNELLDKEEANQVVLTKGIFPSILSKVLEIYNKHYGINKNIINLITELPNNFKEELANGNPPVK